MLSFYQSGQSISIKPKLCRSQLLIMQLQFPMIYPVSIMFKFAKSTYSTSAGMYCCGFIQQPTSEQLDMFVQSQDELCVWQWTQNFNEGKGSEVKFIFRLILVRKDEGNFLKFKTIIPFDLHEYVCEWVFPFFLPLLNPINISTIAFPLIFAGALFGSSCVQHICSFLHKMEQIITSTIFSQSQILEQYVP